MIHLKNMGLCLYSVCFVKFRWEIIVGGQICMGTQGSKSVQEYSMMWWWCSKTDWLAMMDPKWGLLKRSLPDQMVISMRRVLRQYILHGMIVPCTDRSRHPSYVYTWGTRIMNIYVAQYMQETLQKTSLNKLIL